MAVALTSRSLHLLLPLRRSSPNSLLLPSPPIHSQRAPLQGRNANPVRRIASRRSLMVRAAGDNQSNDAESRRLEELEVRLGVGRKSRREGGGGPVEAPPAPRPQAPAKPWDDMSLPEKTWELYIGEKGFLFWLNKLAYASIFLVIGGWIAFRFVGPALGWYELDSPLLPPTEVLSGTAGR